ncbi:hypothetical protein [Leeuwenhoekiella sp. LLG6367-2.1]|uniref:hypothetical protein n=1 Tax=Leeuwenhoekiella sp. LLG6367-2.1 TaxID=3160833 RepID=UPI00386919DE
MPYSDIIAAKKELSFMADGLAYFKNEERKLERIAMINCFIRLVNAGECIYNSAKTFEQIDSLILQEFTTVYAMRVKAAKVCQIDALELIRNEIGLYLSFGSKAALDQCAFELALGFLGDYSDLSEERLNVDISKDLVMSGLLNSAQEQFKPAVVDAVRSIASRCKLLPYADLNQAKKYREDLVQQYNALPKDKKGNKANTINVLTNLINTVEKDTKRSLLADMVCCLILHQMLCVFEYHKGEWTLEMIASQVTFVKDADLDVHIAAAGEVIANDVFAYAEKKNADGSLEALTDVIKAKKFTECKTHYITQMHSVLGYLQESYGLWKS